METKIKLFLFGRWIATSYADTHLDQNMKCIHDEEFQKESSISLLNRQNGDWWMQKAEEFETIIYPEYVKNGTVEKTKELFLTIKL